MACMTAYGPRRMWSGSESICARTLANPLWSPWRTVTTKSPPTKIMISPVSTISRADEIESCST
ncbi:Uncharacterised protein [Mycobacteroides abscessus subsp. abscessus]|nr:Uncharacterised protein [Mycobacteroides abscessus subsp. abscessus]